MKKTGKGYDWYPNTQTNDMLMSTLIVRGLSRLLIGGLAIYLIIYVIDLTQ